MDESWWMEAQMDGFRPTQKSYLVDMTGRAPDEVCEVSISEIKPLIERAKGIGIFHSGGSKERVVKILRAIRTGAPLPPVRLVRVVDQDSFRYKLTDGTHRLYCSIACGFTHIPAEQGFDPNVQGDESLLLP